MAEITDAFKKQYADTIELLSQQVDFKLSSHVMTASGYTGEGVQPVKQLGEVEMADKTSRIAPTPLVEPSYTSRYVKPRTKVLAIPIDTTDPRFIGFDPQSGLMKEMTAAAMRAKDNLVISALDGTALTGKDGSSSASFPNSQNIDVNGGGANSGLNREKILSAQEILLKGDVDLDSDTLCLLISPYQHSDLLKQLDVVDVQNKLSAEIVNGVIKTVHGARVVVSTKLKFATNTRSCFFFAKSGMHLGFWKDYTAKVQERPDLSNITQLYAEMTFGATRLEEKKVVRLQCYEA